MELRRVAEALMRSRTSPLASLLTPTTALRLNAQSQTRCRVEGNKALGRQFSSSTSRNVTWTPVTTSATPAPKEEPASSTTPASPEASIDSLVDSLGWTSRKRVNPTAGKPRADKERTLNGGHSASDILQSLNVARGTPRYDPYSGRNGKPFSLGGMRLDIKGSPGAEPSKTAFTGVSMIPESSKRALMKLGPSTGRTVEIGSGSVDIGRGFQLLNMSCSRNKIAKDSGRQRFHERPGLKRKRLVRERWRQRFAEGFNAAVKRVRTLQRQGW